MSDMPETIWANEHKCWSKSKHYLNNKGKPRPPSHSKAERTKYHRDDVVQELVTALEMVDRSRTMDSYIKAMGYCDKALRKFKRKR